MLASLVYCHCGAHEFGFTLLESLLFLWRQFGVKTPIAMVDLPDQAVSAHVIDGHADGIETFFQPHRMPSFRVRSDFIVSPFPAHTKKVMHYLRRARPDLNRRSSP